LRKALVVALLVALPAGAQPLKQWTGGSTPALELTDTNGKLHRLDDYRGSVVLVNFWATWCAPCREEMPSMEALRAQLAGRPFVILAVNDGEGPRATRGFGEKMGLNFPLLLDGDTKVTRGWSARVLPASFIIGPNGSIRYSHLGALDWQAAEVKSILERLIPRCGDWSRSCFALCGRWVGRRTSRSAHRSSPRPTRWCTGCSSWRRPARGTWWSTSVRATAGS